MKKPEESMPTDLDNVEDLTLFANESFDTDDVDLFEFTGDEDSPLTRLKSIILSLDWEISDDILQELQDEVESLQKLWQGDKVAKVYLQGLYKIGSYLRAEGAYAHPNAIKLLLSFFYNFEKIISSETITGDAISSMLKSDVRKFKILQYQINQKESVHDIGESVESAELAMPVDQESEVAQPECEPLTCLKATILGLEWEVTDKGLNQFNSQIGEIKTQFADNKSAQILIQGLQALGAYITDERADAHSEAFSMLHSFYEGLELLLDEKNIDEEEKQSILVDRVNRLNALKVIIAKEKEAQKQESGDALVDEILAQQEEDQEEPLDVLAEIDEPPVTDDADFLDPDAIMPVEDSIADNLIEEELRVGGGIAALHDEETPDIDEELTISEEIVEEELDLFFVDDEEKTASSADDTEVGADTEDMADLEFAFTDEDLDIALNEVELPEEEDDVLFSDDEDADEEESALDQLFVEEDETGLAPALAEAGEEGGFDENEVLESLPEAPTDEIDDKLDAFFGLDEDEPDAADETVAVAPEKEAGIAPALFDADEEGGFDEHEVAADLEEAPMDEIEDKLDAFFGLDEEETDEIAAATKSGEVEQDDLAVLPALADADEDSGFDEETAVASLSDEPSAEIEDKLDAFFGLDEEETGGEEPEPALAEAADDAIMPALADADEEGGFDEDTVVAGLSEEPSPEIEDKLDAFFSLDEEETPETAPADTDKQQLFTALGTGLAGLAAGVSAAKLTETKESIDTLRQDASLATEQTILLDLLEATLTLLPEGEEQPPAMKELLTSLQGQIEQKETKSTQLLSAVSATLLVVAREVTAMRNKA